MIFPLGWDFWEEYDRVMISKCDKLIVLMLEGFETSKGVNNEIKIAEELNIPVEFMESI